MLRLLTLVDHPDAFRLTRALRFARAILVSSEVERTGFRGVTVAVPD